MAVSDSICTIEYKKGDITTKAAKAFYKNLEKHFVTVGIHREEGGKQVGNNGYTLIQNACNQEFGNTQTVEKTRRFRSPYTGKWFYIKKGTVLNIPPRPFVRILDEKKEKQALTNAFKNQINVNIKNGTAENVYDSVGFIAEWDMKDRITGHKIKPKNSDMTKQYKGSNTPLYQKGDLYNGIRRRVH